MTSIISPAELARVSEFIADAVATKLANEARLVDRNRLSEIIGLSVPTIDRRRTDGSVTFIKTGNRILFDPPAVIAALSAGGDDDG